MDSVCYEPFILENNPAIRINLFRINETKYVLLFVKHNIITDAWSEGVIIKELLKIYQQLVNGNEIDKIEELELQILDISCHERYANNLKNYNNSIKFWGNYFKSYEEFEFPSDYERPDILKHECFRIIYEFTSVNWAKL